MSKQKIHSDFTGNPLYQQFIDSLCESGYHIQRRSLPIKKPYTILGGEENPSRNITVKPDAIYSDKSFPAYKAPNFYARIPEREIELHDQDVYNLQINPASLVDYNVQAGFTSDGNLERMNSCFILHSEIVTVLSCHLEAGTKGKQAVILEISKWYLKRNEISPISSRRIKFTLEDSQFIEEEKKEETWKPCVISLEELDQWKQNLLLEYQTSDAKTMAAVLKFFESIKINSKNADFKRDDLTSLYHEAFSRLIVRCMDYLGKYTDEVLDSMSYDLGLNSSEAMKHILRYVQNK